MENARVAAVDIDVDRIVGRIGDKRGIEPELRDTKRDVIVFRERRRTESLAVILIVEMLDRLPAEACGDAGAGNDAADPLTEPVGRIFGHFE